MLGQQNTSVDGFWYLLTARVWVNLPVTREWTTEGKNNDHDDHPKNQNNAHQRLDEPRPPQSRSDSLKEKKHADLERPKERCIREPSHHEHLGAELVLGSKPR